jgi:hypothetical protein
MSNHVPNLSEEIQFLIGSGFCVVPVDFKTKKPSVD